jgi:YidC/Oxa1 family membrane protein insertase
LAFPFAPLLATNVVLDPIVAVLHWILGHIFAVVHNYGWSLMILAAGVKLAFWPLNTMQFKAMKKTQEIAPQLKALQARYKNDREKLNEATMALYKETGANPLASCAPLIVQMPILISLYYAVLSDKALFATQGWLWIGTSFAQNSPNHILAANLSAPDYVLLALYVVSMYFQVRLSTPAVDPQQAQQQKIMAFVSPVMVAFLGYKYHWPSALIVYWLSVNVFSMAQQFYLMRKYRTGGPPAAGAAALAGAGTGALKGGATRAALPADTALAPGAGASGPGSSRSSRKRRSSRR